VVVIAGWAAGTTARTSRSVPDDGAWRRAAAVVRAEVRAGDLIIFAPPWIDPVGRLHLGDLISVDAAARMDATRFPRIWVVAIRGASSPEVAGERPALRRDLDGISVRRYDRPQASLPVLLDDAARALPSAQVTGAVARGPSLELAEIGFAPRRCVQVVPAPGGSVRITFPHFVLGSQLVGYVGLADVFTRRDVREPVLGGQVLTRTKVGIDDGWVRFSAATTPGVAELTVIASAPSPRARDRLICFALESRR
jgi:hypothetical protein